MSYIYKNIITDAATDLEISMSSTESVTKISMANTHVKDSVSVNLYLSRTEVDPTTVRYINPDTGQRSDNSFDELPTTTYEYSILKNCIIPKGVTLILDESSLFFDQTKYRLYIKLETAENNTDLVVAVDVIISYDKQKESTTMSTGSNSSSY